MTRAILAERVGRVLKDVKGPDGQDAKVVRSIRVKEEFPAHPGIEVLFDYYTDEQGRLAVYVRRRGGNKTNRRNSWTLSAIDSCEAKELKEFAESLGLKGFQLANQIRMYKPAA